MTKQIVSLSTFASTSKKALNIKLNIKIPGDQAGTSGQERFQAERTTGEETEEKEQVWEDSDKWRNLVDI